MICKNCGCEVKEGCICGNCGTAAEISFVTDEKTNSYVEEKSSRDPGKVLGIIGMALGIQSVAGMVTFFLCGCYPVYGWVFYGVILLHCLASAIVGLILSSNAIKSSTEAGFENKMANLGKKFSTIGLVAATILLTIIIAFFIIYFVIIIIAILINFVSTMFTMIFANIESAIASSYDYGYNYNYNYF